MGTDSGLWHLSARLPGLRGVVSLCGKDSRVGGVVMNLVLFCPPKLDWRDSLSAQEALMGCGLQGLGARIRDICIRGPAECKLCPPKPERRRNGLEKNGNEVRQVLLSFQKKGKKGDSKNRLSAGCQGSNPDSFPSQPYILKRVSPPFSVFSSVKGGAGASEVCPAGLLWD